MFEANKNYTLHFISKPANWMQLLSYIRFSKIDIMLFNSILVIFYCAAFIIQFYYYRNPDKKHINKTFLISGFKAYIGVII